jgi:manganese efflux pump family protein
MVMGVLALIIWLLTAGAGLYLLAVWLIEYDRDFQRAAATRLPVPLISAHALLAVSGLVVWSAYLLFDNDRLAWAAVAILAGVAALGLTMAGRWLGVYRTTARPARGSVAAPNPVPPERHFPLTVVISHGIFAVTTIVLVLMTALGVGTS